MRHLFVLTVLVATGALVLASVGAAGPPTGQTLNPPVPSYYTCKAVGNGTICDGQPALETWSNVDTADEGSPIVCGSTPFPVYDSGADQLTARRIYNADGNLVRRVLRDDYSFGELSNPLTGATVPYDQSDIRTEDLAVPGDLGSATLTTTWNIHFHAQGAGAPVFMNTGRTVQAPDGTTEFRAGRLEFSQLFEDGDTSVLGPLCAALEA